MSESADILRGLAKSYDEADPSTMTPDELKDIFTRLASILRTCADSQESHERTIERLRDTRPRRLKLSCAHLLEPADNDGEKVKHD